MLFVLGASLAKNIRSLQLQYKLKQSCDWAMLLRPLPVTEQEATHTDRHITVASAHSNISKSMDHPSRSREQEEGKVEDGEYKTSV